MATRDIGRATVAVFLAEGVALPAGLLLAAMLSRSLGVDGYGSYGLAASIVVGIEFLISAAYNRISIQLLSDVRDGSTYVPAVLRHYFFTALLALAGILLLANAIETLLSAPGLARALQWLSLDLPLFALAQAQRSILTANGQYSGRAAAIAVRWCGRVGITWLLLRSGFGLAGALWAWPLASIAELVAMRRLPLRELWRRGAPQRWIWREGWSPFLFAAGQRLMERMDLLMLEAYGAAGFTAGIYVAAQNLAILPGLFGASLSPVLLAAMTHEHIAGRSEASRQAGDSALRATISLWPVAAIFHVCGRDLARFLFGEPFGPAGGLLGWLVAGSVGMAISGVVVSIAGAQGKHRLSAWFSLPCALSTAVLLSIAVPRFSMQGAAIVTGGCGFVFGLSAVVYQYMDWRRPVPVRTVIRVAAACLGVVSASRIPGIESVHVVPRMVLLSLVHATILVILGEWRLQQVRALCVSRS